MKKRNYFSDIEDRNENSFSVIADFDYVLPAAIASLEGKQLQPTFL